MDETQPLLLASNDRAEEARPDLPPDAPQSDIIEDPNNPLNWSKAYRWSVVLMLAFMSCTGTFTCTAVIPVAGRIVQDIAAQDNKSTSILFVTIWELGEATGPLLIAPLSELYGRWPVFNVANGLFILGVALTLLSSSTEVLVLSRFLTGCAVASNVLNPAIIADIFPPEARGSAMSIIVLGLLTGGAVGPLTAGAIVQSSGWRGILWISITMAGVCELAFLLLFRETYRWSAHKHQVTARVRTDTSAQPPTNALDFESEKASSALWYSIQRPITVLSSSLVLQIMCLWSASLYAFFYIMSTTLPDILQDTYDFTPALIGSSFLVFSFGSLLGNVMCSFLLDRIYVKVQQAKQDSKPRPEGRLPLLAVSAFGLPLTIALYGMVPDQHWPVWLLLLAVALLGFLFSLNVITVMTYVADAFGLYSASAMTAVLVTRCLVGTFFPLLTTPLTKALGYGVAFLLLSAIALVVAPIPLLIWWHGARWRRFSKYTDSQ